MLAIIWLERKYFYLDSLKHFNLATNTSKAPVTVNRNNNNVSCYVYGYALRVDIF